MWTDLRMLYEDESIIIRNAVAFVFLLAALSFFACIARRGFSSYHNCACLKLLGQSLCPNRNVNHGRSTFRLHQGRTAFSHPLFFVVWSCYQGPKYIADFQHNTGTVFCPQRSVYEWIEKFKNGRTSVKHEGSGACVARCSAKNIFFLRA